jgi:hypothetical protein
MQNRDDRPQPEPGRWRQVGNSAMSRQRRTGGRYGGRALDCKASGSLEVYGAIKNEKTDTLGITNTWLSVGWDESLLLKVFFGT